MRNSSWLLAGLLLSGTGSTMARAETRRALVIGINTYQPPAPTPAPDGKPFRWINLDGAINDAQGMKAMLMARFGFAEADIELLTEAAASRQGILDGMQHLVDRSRPGDVALIFYAGHGSRVKNSLSAERDQWDETMVPADSHKGTPDITDKEISEKLNAMIDKQAIVTAIFDSCHSGSISRGPHRKTRDAAPDPTRDTKDARKLPDPVSRGALILSAAQDYQTASEDVEIVEGKDIPHGAFSVALFSVLRASRGTDPADRIALSLRAMLQSEGGSQEPSLEANAARRSGPLIGSGRGTVSGGDAMAIPVLRIAGESKLELQAGPALGIAKGSVLVLDRKEAGKPPLRIEITNVIGMARAEAKVLDGTTKGLRVGIDRFVVQSWVPASGKGLSIFAPAADQKAIEAVQRELQALRAAKQLEWIDDLEKQRPTHVIAWTGTAWRLAGSDGTRQDLGATLQATTVLERLAASTQKPRLWVALPPSTELRRALARELETKTAALSLAKEADRAQYVVVGRANSGGAIEYALVQTDLTLPCRAPEGKAAICEPGGGLPAATRWVSADIAPTLTELAMRLAKVHGWLTLDAQAPEDFPYALSLKPKGGGAQGLIASGTLRDGERYELVLETKPENLEKLIVPRFVYVFALSSDGSSALLFPRADACGVEARVPFATSAGVHRQAQVTLASIKVGPPFGVDTYVMLSTQEALPNCAILTSAGVREVQKTRGAGSPLSRLVEGIASATRGAGVETPTTWSVDRLVFKSAPSSPQK